MRSKNVYNVSLKLALLSMIVLLMLTFITAKHIDIIELPNAELYPFYYFLMQPITIWIIIPLAVFLIMFSSRPFYRLIAILSLAFIIEFLPSFMMINPWLPDQYPYLSEAYWIYLHGNISDVHYLSVVPGLGLTYGIFEILTDLDPFAISKAFSFIQAFIFVIMLSSLSKRLTKNKSLLPLLFLSFNYFAQINVFHRATLHFTYALTFLYIILSIINEQHFEWRQIIVLSTVFSAMVLTYPGSGYMLITIIGAYMLLFIIRKALTSSIKLLILVLSTIFGIWYCYTAWSEIRVAGSILNSLMEVLRLGLRVEESMVHPFSTGLTPLFKTLVYVRLIIEGGVIAVGLLIALYMYILALISRLKGKNSDIPPVYTLMLASLIAPAPWLLTEWSRWSFYKFSMYFLLLSLITVLYHSHQHHPRRRIMFFLVKILIIIIITSALALVPLLRYASIPYLNITTSELSSVSFIHRHFMFNLNCYYLEYPPYISMLVHGKITHEVSSMYWFENLSKGLYVITSRALIRDGFYTYPQPLQIRLKELESFISVQGEKVYDNGYNRAYYLR